jgi:hypothetical protein
MAHAFTEYIRFRNDLRWTFEIVTFQHRLYGQISKLACASVVFCTEFIAKYTEKVFDVVCR